MNLNPKAGGTVTQKEQGPAQAYSRPDTRRKVTTDPNPTQRGLSYHRVSGTKFPLPRHHRNLQLPATPALEMAPIPAGNTTPLVCPPPYSTFE